MSATILYDDPTLNQLNVSSSLPKSVRALERINHGEAIVSGTVAFDTSYPTGGYGPLNKFGLKTVAGVFIEDVNGYGVYYNKSTDKIQVFSGGGTEVANATNLSAVPAAYFRAEGLWF